MNIFEIFQNQRNQKFNTDCIIKLSQNWLQFKMFINNIFKSQTFNQQDVQNIWAELTKTSPNLVNMIINYYFNYLDEYFVSVFAKDFT